ncbi:MAG TPA: zinc finger domain-containing protein, partial [Alphaproteobacteria bacterium]|nr:zinc finger domain-containing protein [Alphaproteobacteria bacterium]
IGSSLQAHPLIYLDKSQKGLFDQVHIAEIMITSAADIIFDIPPAEAFRLPDVAQVAVVVQLANGQKCERCWQILPEVGSITENPTLCTRCHDVVQNHANHI